MRSLDFNTPKYVVRGIFFQDSISVSVCVCIGMYVCMYVCMCVRGGVEVEIPIVMLCAGEGSVKIAPSEISCKYSV